jgi:hypothetical protein
LGIPVVSPASPVQGQRINISIAVTDNVMVGSVSVYCKTNTSSSWTTFSATQTGAVYETSIGSYGAGVNVTYYLNATDAWGGNIALSPRNAPTSYYSFVVGQATSPSGGGSNPTVIVVISVVAIVALVLVIAVVLLVRRGKIAGSGKRGRN